MKQIIIDKEKLITALKKYLYLIVLSVGGVIIIYNIIFIVIEIKNSQVDQSKVSATEQKVNENGYNQVIQKDNQKKEATNFDLNKLNNPF